MVALLLFVAAFGVYAATASPVLGWLDSPEFVAASASLGVAHSPGHPAEALVGRLATLLPVGDVAFRVNLISAICAAACAVIVFYTARAALERLAGPPPQPSRASGGRSRSLPASSRTIFAAGVALVFAFCWASWIQAVRAEVYALQASLCIGVIHAVITLEATRDRRWLVWAGLLSGLALATHHLIALLVIAPAAVSVLAIRRMRRADTLGTCALAGVLGLAVFAYLPVRSQAGPELNWAAPHTADRFAWTVTAKAFQKATTQKLATSRSAAAAYVVVTVVEETTVPLSALAVFGLLWGLRRRRAPCGLLAGVLVVGLAGRVLVGFEPGTPDHHGYLLPALAAWLVLAAVGAAALTEMAIAVQPSLRRGATIAALAVLLVAPVQVLANAPRASMRGAYASDELARWELEDLPPRALLLLGYYETSFRVAALRAVEASRPDLSILDRSFLTYPGTAIAAKRRYPELAELIDAPLRADRPTPLARLAEIADRRPVLLQLHFNLERDVHRNLLPVGSFALFLPGPPADSVRDGAETFDRFERQELEQWIVAPASGADAEGANRAALWHDVMRLDAYCTVGRIAAAQEALDRAWSLAPDDATLRETARSCGLKVVAP